MNIDHRSDWFIRGVAEGDPMLDAASVQQLAEQLGIATVSSAFYCIAVQALDHKLLIRDANLPVVFLNVCSQVGKNLPGFLHCYLGTKLRVVFVFHDSMSRELNSQRILSLVSKRLGSSARIGVGKIYRDIMKLSYSRVDAFEALDSSSVSGIYFADDIYASRSLTNRKLEGEKRHVIDLFRAGLFDEMMTSLARLSEHIREESPVRDGMPYPTSIRRTVIELLVEILHIGADAGMDVDRVLDNQDPYTRVFELHGTPKILAWFLEISRRIFNGMQEVKSQSENNMLTQAKRCIDAHIQDPDLSLQLVSEELGITPGYFSAFFIRETNMGFSEYITGIRVEMAKQLLLETSKKIHDIAVQCGFQTSSYFIFVFRKKTGLSPGVFRKMNQK